MPREGLLRSSRPIERRAYAGKDVEKFVERTDKYRSDFYRYYTGQGVDGCPQL